MVLIAVIAFVFGVNLCLRFYVVRMFGVADCLVTNEHSICTAVHLQAVAAPGLCCAVLKRVAAALLHILL